MHPFFLAQQNLLATSTLRSQIWEAEQRLWQLVYRISQLRRTMVPLKADVEADRMYTDLITHVGVASWEENKLQWAKAKNRAIFASNSFRSDVLQLQFWELNVEIDEMKRRLGEMEK